MHAPTTGVPQLVASLPLRFGAMHHYCFAMYLKLHARKHAR